MDDNRVTSTTESCAHAEFPYSCPRGKGYRADPDCPAGWRPKNVGRCGGDCWTCCRGTKASDSRFTADKTDEKNEVEENVKSSVFEEQCISANFPFRCPFGQQSKTPVCPDGWKSKNVGEDSIDCWTCCRRK